jgi:hypothetical protein
LGVEGDKKKFELKGFPRFPLRETKSCLVQTSATPPTRHGMESLFERKKKLNSLRQMMRIQKRKWAHRHRQHILELQTLTLEAFSPRL